MHGTALLLDRTVRMPVAGLFVPGASPYRPVAVAFGVVAAELMALVVVSFSVRQLIGQKRWRLLHWSTYAIFGLATAHGLLAGSDSAQPWARDLYLGAVAAVAFATAWRARLPPPARRRRREEHMMFGSSSTARLQRLRRLRRSRARGFELDAHGKALLRIGASSDPAVSKPPPPAR